MFSRFFKSKFYKKSKSCLNTTKLRVEIIQRKRNAVQEFLKNDIAEFLRRGLDYNAYQRAAGLLMEYDKSLCYELIDKYSECVLNHLDDLNKQRDLPDECKEAIQTLIYAAARFGDLPELRELRALLRQKYENSFEPYLSKEFVTKSRQDLPTRETKIQLLYDIAGEFSLQWDGNALIQQIHRPPSMCEGRSRDEELSKNEDGSNRGGEEGRDSPSQGRNEDVNNVTIIDSGDEDESTTSTDLSSRDGKKASSSSSSASFSEDNDDEAEKRPFSRGIVPPPYLIPKPNHDKVEANLQNEEKPKPKPKAISVRTIRSGPPAGHVHPKLPESDDLATQLASIRQR
ncbi:uncharacterized protein LOC129289790 [Prosopis cineraria]|uniref:uncharacterized protein LOC129289790 n=1 Tax=Prosopis cineraria TaxID=364024 RepID=UPI00240FF854|nr:uncharacterized protein LOC129289790 [Prosopis cineraria]